MYGRTREYCESVSLRSNLHCIMLFIEQWSALHGRACLFADCEEYIIPSRHVPVACFRIAFLLHVLF